MKVTSNNNLGNKKTMANNLKYFMNKNGISRNQLSTSLNIAYTTLADWLNAKTYPRIDKIEMLANYFGIEKSDLVEEHTQSTLSMPEPVTFMTIPLYGDISCGNGMFVDDNIIDNIKIAANGLSGREEDYFAQVASGDSMINAGIENGDILIFKKSNVIDDGQIGSFCIDDGIATCKKFKKGETYIQLIPMNASYDPIVVDLNNINFRIVGILKRAIKDFE